MNFYEKIRNLVFLSDFKEETSFSLKENDVAWNDRRSKLSEIQLVYPIGYAGKGGRNSEFGWGRILISPEDESVRYTPTAIGDILINPNGNILVKYSETILSPKFFIRNPLFVHRNVKEFVRKIDDFQVKKNGKFFPVEDDMFFLESERTILYSARNGEKIAETLEELFADAENIKNLKRLVFWNNTEYEYEILSYGKGGQYLTKKEWETISVQLSAISPEKAERFRNSVIENGTTYLMDDTEKIENLSKKLPNLIKKYAEDLEFTDETLPPVTVKLFFVEYEMAKIAVAASWKGILPPDGSIEVQLPLKEATDSAMKKILLEYLKKEAQPELLAYVYA